MGSGTGKSGTGGGKRRDALTLHRGSSLVTDEAVRSSDDTDLNVAIELVADAAGAWMKDGR